MSTVLEYAGGFENSFMDTARLLSQNPSIRVQIVTMNENFSNTLEDFVRFYYRRKRNKILRESILVIKERIGKVDYIKCKNFKELRNYLKEADVVYSKNEILETIILKC